MADRAEPGAALVVDPAFEAAIARNGEDQVDADAGLHDGADEGEP
jgi:hypothetical protein